MKIFITILKVLVIVALLASVALFGFGLGYFAFIPIILAAILTFEWTKRAHKAGVDSATIAAKRPRLLRMLWILGIVALCVIVAVVCIEVLGRPNGI